MELPVPSPVRPMLAKKVDALPAGDAWIYEPKWDGFRTLVFRCGDELLFAQHVLPSGGDEAPEQASDMIHAAVLASALRPKRSRAANAVLLRDSDPALWAPGHAGRVYRPPRS